MDLLKSDNERWRVHYSASVCTSSLPKTRRPANASPGKTRSERHHVISVREGRFSLEDVFIGVVEKGAARGKGSCRRVSISMD